MAHTPIALEAYEALADAYAALIDTKPHNAYYERPATLSLLPDVNGRRVLDAGCGPGVYSDWLIQNGAEVVAIDASPRMIELTKQRLKRSNGIFQADLGQPLTFLSSSSFDVVISPLVMNYIDDWGATLTEFYRVLASPGYLVFSVSHPFFDYTYFKSEDYFRTELVGSEWKGFGERVYMPSFRRSLSQVLNPIIDSGFQLERILEPKPTDEFRRADPQGYDELSRFPSFLCIRTRK